MCGDYDSLRGRSTTHYLTLLTHKLLEASDKPGHITTLALTDFSRAFDFHPQRIDLTLRQSLVLWIPSFISGRLQSQLDPLSPAHNGDIPDADMGMVALKRDAQGSSLDPARDLTAARPNCKSRSAPYRKPHGSRRETDRAPDGSLTETGRQGDQNRCTLGVMTPAGVYTEDMPNGRRFKCD
ncbi:hypothetical protein Bbelb_020810 [Branchiostoma belcheri]|nr:hypothetical protein Bbelb_020810 [Branchiostoma belcheri]